MEHRLVEIAGIDEKMGTICRDCKALDYSTDSSPEEIIDKRRWYHSQLIEQIKGSWKNSKITVSKSEEKCKRMYSFSKPF